MPTLIIVDSPWESRQEGWRYRLRPGESGTIGRAEENTIRLKDVLVSSRHARLDVAADGTATLRDLGSTNGTLVNQKPIAGPHELRDGDEIYIGQTTLRFADDSAMARPAPAPSGSSEELAHVLALLEEVRRQRDQLEAQNALLREQLTAAMETQRDLQRLLGGAVPAAAPPPDVTLRPGPATPPPPPRRSGFRWPWQR